MDHEIQVQRRGRGHGREGQTQLRLGTKVAAARDHVDNDMTKTEVMAKYAIASVAPLERWCREYRTGGPEACISSNRGGRFQHLI